MEIRTATLEDAARILEIYAPYVEKTAITFETEVPDITEMRSRIEGKLKEYPYLVAVIDGEIEGYAYAGHFHERAAYDHSAEVSIYITDGYKERGIGRALYEKLEELLKKQNVYVCYACIASTERENDENLTDASIRFHKKMGYGLAGTFTHCGYKFGKWYSMVWMEKPLCERPANPGDFIPFKNSSLWFQCMK
ncbi:MAG: N-acetyltransferase [Lachnospiraceae bacterium]|nr:N-acetyltransferase [Lachnospiraceae bacterium]